MALRTAHGRARELGALVVIGDEPLRIMQRAGHEAFETTSSTSASRKTFGQPSAKCSRPCRPSCSSGRNQGFRSRLPITLL